MLIQLEEPCCGLGVAKPENLNTNTTTLSTVNTRPLRAKTTQQFGILNRPNRPTPESNKQPERLHEVASSARGPAGTNRVHRTMLEGFVSVQRFLALAFRIWSSSFVRVWATAGLDLEFGVSGLGIQVSGFLV